MLITRREHVTSIHPSSISLSFYLNSLNHACIRAPYVLGTGGEPGWASQLRHCEILVEVQITLKTDIRSSGSTNSHTQSGVWTHVPHGMWSPLHYQGIHAAENMADLNWWTGPLLGNAESTGDSKEQTKQLIDKWMIQSEHSLRRTVSHSAPELLLKFKVSFFFHYTRDIGIGFLKHCCVHNFFVCSWSCAEIIPLFALEKCFFDYSNPRRVWFRQPARCSLICCTDRIILLSFAKFDLSNFARTFEAILINIEYFELNSLVSFLRIRKDHRIQISKNSTSLLSF